MKIAGLYNWHDGGYCILEDGIVKEHIEHERYTRVKADGGDSLQRLIKNKVDIEKIDHWVSSAPNTNLEKGGGNTYETHKTIPKSKINFYSHHLCHAAHSFYSSSFVNSIVLTLDMMGLDCDGSEWSTCVFLGNNKKIRKLSSIHSNQMSLGNLWTKCTRFIFKLSAGHPRGSQAGSVMAMAALGSHEKYYDDFMKMATVDFGNILIPPRGMVRGWVEPDDDVVHPYLDKYRKIAESDENEKMNMAASLQKVTEDIVFDIVDKIIKYCKLNNIEHKNLCLSGGVSLNSVMTGKLKSRYQGEIDNFFIPPVPYDGGLNIGACQYHWHHVLENDRILDTHVSPYLGEAYTEDQVLSAISDKKDKILKEEKTINDIVDLLCGDKIISIFQGRSESGRRALGNRSIIANPINPKMKDFINKKVKHRQWYRPFAPSVLHEHGEEWFENYFNSPYMGFVFKLNKEKLGLAPAIEHEDGTARIQSVTSEMNQNYYNLINLFFKKTGVPMVLNTSFNDREPIVETPADALNCFLKTNIDYLYFADHNILISRIDND